MSDVDTVLKLIKENDVQSVDFRFTDPRGKWQHTTQHVGTVDGDMLSEGIMFDGSSITGWKDINDSDMILRPDLSTAIMDPFEDEPSLILVSDVIEPSTGEPYARDPRSIAKLAEGYLQTLGIGDTAFFGPELEFFVFDSVRFAVDQHNCFYTIDSTEGPYNSGRDYPDGNLAHRPGPKGGYFPVPPVDQGSPLRREMLSVLQDMGVEVEKHHHEVAPSQHELGIRFDTLVRSADAIQKYKYVVHMVADRHGKTATFMPKPVMHDNGSGMHVHQSLWKDGVPLFAGDKYAGLSDLALFYIGGIIKHARAINAFTNPATNSYKRLVPGYEAPVLLAYSSRNRSASCRIPHGSGPKEKRVEVRFPDCMANPYLAFAAMMMAGLEGIMDKIHPGDPMDVNLYDLSPGHLKDVPTVSESLRQACQALDDDRDFLTRGGVFSDDLIDGYLELKWEEILDFETTTHPIEFQKYYSA